ncbi:MAG: [citrate (pro-3S)-lyase] ligase [Spirochaetia bacterium]|jgi:[citrate (pro-3S)-lyase] ligase|nr:[citrate (pro-3S)-lyase] ligase [Spirochaetia bacterium]
MTNQENISTDFRKKLAPFEKTEIQGFLAANGLTFEDDIEETAIVRENNEIIATGSISGNVLKCIAIKPDIRGSNLAGSLITALIQKQYYRGISNLFIFTKPQNSSIFSRLGFYVIYEVENEAVLMENNPAGLSLFIENLKKETAAKQIVSSADSALESSSAEGSTKNISSIVVNCNPFTKGHLYLIEKGASESAFLHIFVLSEDRSLFPTETRFDLVKKGTQHIKNLAVHSGSDYIISNSTFPSYFIKDARKIYDIHAKMDLGIFSEKIAPALNITRRFAGEEPLCPVTNNYNRLMAEILPQKGIEFTVIKRLESGGNPVSASRVRALIKENRLEETEALLPPVTYNFLKSPEGEKIIKKIRGIQG